MIKRVSGRVWLSLATAVILVVIVYLSRHEIMQSWHLLGKVDMSIIPWLIPLQFLSFYSMGASMFSYLRAQGRARHISAPDLARLSLEMNFVNHILPSAGVSGVSYIGWRLKFYGISPSKSAAAQLIRIVATFIAYVVILLVSVTAMLFDGSLNRLTVIVTIGLAILIFGVVAIVVYILESNNNFENTAKKIINFVNKSIQVITFGHHKKGIKSSKSLAGFLNELQKDYCQVKSKKKMIIKPFFWGLVLNLSDIAMFYCVFLALGHPINPAPLVAAYGLAGASSIFMVTPGGAGAYELIMVAFLAAAGIDNQAGIAAIVLTRVLLMAGTIIGGYAFYQQAIVKRGKSDDTDANS